MQSIERKKIIFISKAVMADFYLSFCVGRAVSYDSLQFQCSFSMRSSLSEVELQRRRDKWRGDGEQETEKTGSVLLGRTEDCCAAIGEGVTLQQTASRLNT